MSGLAVVTGGARGVGLAIVRALLEQRIVERVAVFDLEAGTIPADGSWPEIPIYACDVTDEASVRSAYASVGEVPTVLVNNAGGGRLDRVQDGAEGDNDAFNPFGSVESFRDMVDLNLTSAHVVTSVIGPDLEAGSVICNTASIAGQMASSLFSYGAAKAGLINWTTSMAKALAPKKIRVNAVAPGIIRTQLWEAMQPSEKEYDAMIEQIMPMQQDQSPENIADAVAFLCSDRASQITGEVIRIDGGLTLN